jgi:hypothetical protein
MHVWKHCISFYMHPLICIDCGVKIFYKCIKSYSIIVLLIIVVLNFTLVHESLHESIPSESLWLEKV